jgi:hypothetical protein
MMRTMIHKLKLLIFLISLLGQNTGFSQCAGYGTTFTENFNDNTVTTNNTTGPSSGWYKEASLDANQNLGSYAAACGGQTKITNNIYGCCHAASDNWKSNSTADPTKPTTGNDAGDATDFAFFVDGCGSVPNGSVWCTSITVAPGEIYDFSAYLSSPWNQDKANDPQVYFTINGVTITPATVVDEYNGTLNLPTPYAQQGCYYTIPAGTSGSVSFCINMSQESAGVYPVANGQGNDILVDDIAIHKITSVTGCPSIGTCPPPTAAPVELLSFDAKKTSNNSASLMWATASEKNSSYFSIEKSDDGINFSEIGIARAQGTSNNIVNYKFDDNYFKGICYYRLKMVDQDGSFTYSSVQFLETGNSSARIIKTESGEMEIRTSVNEDTRWNIAVYSLLGQEYTNQNVQLTKGENTLLKGVSWGERSAKIVRITSLDGSVILSQVAIW